MASWEIPSTGDNKNIGSLSFVTFPCFRSVILFKDGQKWYDKRGAGILWSYAGGERQTRSEKPRDFGGEKPDTDYEAMDSLRSPGATKKCEQHTGGDGFNDFSLLRNVGKWSNLTNIFQMGWKLENQWKSIETPRCSFGQKRNQPKHEYFASSTLGWFC